MRLRLLLRLLRREQLLQQVQLHIEQLPLLLRLQLRRVLQLLFYVLLVGHLCLVQLLLQRA